MKKSLGILMMAAALLAAVLTAHSAAYADYGFSQSTNSGYGLGDRQKNDCENNNQNNKSGKGSADSQKTESSPLQVSFHGYIDFADGGTGSWSADVLGGSAPYRYEWNLEGAGTISTYSTAQRTFQTAGKGGRGNLTLTVWDSAGHSVQVSRLVVVKAKNGQYPQYGIWGF
jgi:hypothetical protein